MLDSDASLLASAEWHKKLGCDSINMFGI